MTYEEFKLWLGRWVKGRRPSVTTFHSMRAFHKYISGEISLEEFKSSKSGYTSEPIEEER